MLTPYVDRMQCISFKTSHDCVLIDLMCFDNPWNRDEFIAQLNRPRTFGRVVVGTDGVTVLGYIVYAIPGKVLQVLRMAVHPSHQWSGVGTAMLRRVMEKWNLGAVDTVVEVPGTAVAMQRMLSKCGFYGETVSGSDPELLLFTHSF